MTTHNRIDGKLAEEAAEWVDRLARNPHDSPDEFRAWACRSPSHIEEFLIARFMFAMLHNVDPGRQIDVDELISTVPTSVVPLRGSMTPAQQLSSDLSAADSSAPEVSARVRRSRRYWVSALAAGVLFAVAISVVWLPPWNGTTYSTGLGERRSVRLADGSFIELNTRSSVRVQFTHAARSVTLIQGEALFRVAHDPRRSFWVATPMATIRAVGTQFDVYLAKSDTRVTVVEGTVQVSSDAERSQATAPPEAPGDHAGQAAQIPIPAEVTLQAGEQVNVSPRGTLLKQTQANVSGAIAWRSGRLLFDGVPLSEVVQEFGRYSDFKFTLVGEDLPRRKISGVFYADDPLTLVSLFDGDSSVEVQHIDNGVVVKSR